MLGVRKVVALPNYTMIMIVTHAWLKVKINVWLVPICKLEYVVIKGQILINVFLSI